MKRVLASLFFFGVFAFSVSGKAETAYGMLMLVSGTLDVHHLNQDFKAVKVGQKIFEGDTLSTGPASRAKVVMPDRTVLTLQASSELKVAVYQSQEEAQKKVELNLNKGQLNSEVNSPYKDTSENHFQVRTPTAVAGVRGTQFMTTYDEKSLKTSVATLKGAVTFASVDEHGKMIGNPVIVNKGETAQAAAHAAPEHPKAMSPDQLKELEKSAGPGKDESTDKKGNESKDSRDSNREKSHHHR